MGALALTFLPLMKRKPTKKPILPKDVREVQEAAAEASWDALERYRDTGEMVPIVRDGKLALVTVDEAMRMRPDYEERKAANAAWRRQNLIDQFAAAGIELTPDVWERLRADRRQALEDDLAWMGEKVVKGEKGERVVKGERGEKNGI